MNGCVAVFDVGKTNMKLVVFDRRGRSSWPSAALPTHAPRPTRTGPYRSLYTEGAWAFLIGALKELGARFPIEAISISAHGAAGVLVGDKDAALPPLDYEFDIDGAIAADYDKVRPPFEETLSPHLPRGLNLGRQIYYLQRRFPGRVRGRARLPGLSAILVMAPERRCGDGIHRDGRAYGSVAPV